MDSPAVDALAALVTNAPASGGKRSNTSHGGMRNRLDNRLAAAAAARSGLVSNAAVISGLNDRDAGKLQKVRDLLKEQQDAVEAERLAGATALSNRGIANIATGVGQLGKGWKDRLTVYKNKCVRLLAGALMATQYVAGLALAEEAVIQALNAYFDKSIPNRVVQLKEAGVFPEVITENYVMLLALLMMIALVFEMILPKGEAADVQRELLADIGDDSEPSPVAAPSLSPGQQAKIDAAAMIARRAIGLPASGGRRTRRHRRRRPSAPTRKVPSFLRRKRSTGPRRG